MRARCAIPPSKRPRRTNERGLASRGGEFKFYEATSLTQFLAACLLPLWPQAPFRPHVLSALFTSVNERAVCLYLQNRPMKDERARRFALKNFIFFIRVHTGKRYLREGVRFDASAGV